MAASLDEKMAEAITWFTEAEDKARHESDRVLYTHLKAMAAGIQEDRRVLDYIQKQIEEIHHELGLR